MSTVAKLTPAAPFTAGTRAFSLQGLVHGWIEAFRRAKAQDQIKQDLLRLTPHLLRDIGLSDDEIRDLRQTQIRFEPNDFDRRRLG